MRIFQKDRRISHSLANIHQLFSEEYLYYSNHNVRTFNLGGIAYESLYRRLNVQLLITMKCLFDCDFCIEKINPASISEKQDLVRQLANLQKILSILISSGMEPLLFPENCLQVSHLLQKMGIAYNLNTAGLISNIVKSFNRINLSVHHFDPIQNATSFGVVRRNRYWEHPYYKTATIQTVLKNPSLNYVTSFLESFSNPRYSFRFVSETDSKDIKPVEWYDLFESINSDGRFVFRQQKIGDYYFFEEYSYGKKLVRFSFSSIAQLNSYKKLEHQTAKNYVRAVVIKPDGEIQFDWIP